LHVEEQVVLQMGAGNSAYQTGDLSQAEAIFRSMAEQHPLNAAALNNLATVLQAQDRLAEALPIAERASVIAGPWQAQAQFTRDAIRNALQASPQ
jgi:Flp pilus assembly protein TadD